MTTIFSVLLDHYNKKTIFQSKREALLKPCDEAQIHLRNAQITKDAESLPLFVNFPDPLNMQGGNFNSMKAVFDLATFKASKGEKWMTIEEKKSSAWANYFSNKNTLLTDTSKTLKAKGHKYTALFLESYETITSNIACFFNKSALNGLEKHNAAFTSLVNS